MPASRRLAGAGLVLFLVALNQGRDANAADCGEDLAVLQQLRKHFADHRALDASFAVDHHMDEASGGGDVQQRLWTDADMVADLLKLLLPRIPDDGPLPAGTPHVDAAEAFLASLPPAESLNRYTAAYVKAYLGRVAAYRSRLSQESPLP